MRKGREVVVESSTDSDDSDSADRFRIVQMRKGKEVVVESRTESDDSDFAERFRIVPSVKVTGVPSEGEVKKTSQRNENSLGEAKQLPIQGTDDWMSADSFVRLRRGQSTSVVRITRLERDPSVQSKHKVHVRWCYRPEETKAGRQPFHGEDELLISDRETVEDWTSVVGTCKVFSLEDAIKRGAAGDADEGTYFWRFEYERESGNCYRIDYYCIKCDGRYKVGPLTLQQQLTGEPPYFTCPQCSASRA